MLQWLAALGREADVFSVNWVQATNNTPDYQKKYYYLFAVSAGAGRGFSTTGVTGRLNTGGRGGGGRPAEYLLIRTHDFESRAAALGHCILWHCCP